MILRVLTDKCRSPKVFFRACLVLGIAGAVLGEQAGQKLVRCDDPAQITDAVMISNVSVAGKTVECGLFIKPPLVIQPVAPFPAGSDWLQQMTISLINRTNKNHRLWRNHPSLSRYRRLPVCTLRRGKPLLWPNARDRCIRLENRPASQARTSRETTTRMEA